MTAQEVPDDGVPVDRMVDRLAHLPVLDRALGPRVELVVGDDHPVGRLADDGVRARGHALHLVGRDVLDDVGLAVEQGGDPRGGLGDEPERDALDLRLAAPVVGVRLQRHPVALHPLDELEGAGPDRMEGEVVALLLHVLWRQHDDAPAARVGGAGQEHGERPLADHVDRVLVDDLDPLHRGERRLGPRLRVVELALDAELDGVRVEGLPVVELHAAAQLELVRGRADEPPRLGQAAGEPHPLVPDQQGIEDVPGDVVGRDLAREMGVERRRLGGEADRQPAALLRRRLAGEREPDQQDEDRGARERVSHRMRRIGVLLVMPRLQSTLRSSRGRRPSACGQGRGPAGAGAVSS